MKKVLLMAIAFCFTFATYPAMADPAAGEALFKGSAKCKNCHKVTAKKKVGPGLAAVVDRAGEDWIKGFLADPKAVWTADEGYTKTLKAAVERVEKPKPKHKTKKLTEQQISDLVDYLKTLK
ncbi:MAG: cytochrome c [Nitrospinota bacterium]|nr:cytochrome c [Nitrospinota bacterium]